MAAVQRIQVPVPGRFVPDCLFHDGFHALKIQALDGILISCMEAGLQLAICRQAQAVAFAAEMGADRTDQADVSQSAGQTVQLRNAPVMGSLHRFRQLFQHSGMGT